MKLSFTFYIFLYLFCNVSYSQCDEKLTFTELEKDKFVHTYVDAKKYKPNETLLLNVLKKHNIGPSQYRELINSNSDDSELSKKENEFVTELLQLKKSDEERKLSYIKEASINNNLEWTKYESLLHQYKNCIKFQRSLSPLFKKWMK